MGRELGHLGGGAHEKVSHRMKLASISILILTLVICGTVKSRSTENLVASAAVAEAKLKDADEANRRLMALSEEERRRRGAVAEKPHSFEIEWALNLKPEKAQFLASSRTRIRQRC